MILGREGSSQLLLVGHDGSEDHLLGFLDGALQASACRVFVSSAVEELLRHLAAMEPIARTEADAYDLVLLGVLAQRDGEFEFLIFCGMLTTPSRSPLTNWKRRISSRVTV